QRVKRSQSPSHPCGGPGFALGAAECQHHENGGGGAAASAGGDPLRDQRTGLPVLPMRSPLRRKARVLWRRTYPSAPLRITVGSAEVPETGWIRATICPVSTLSPSPTACSRTPSEGAVYSFAAPTLTLTGVRC